MNDAMLIMCFPDSEDKLTMLRNLIRIIREAVPLQIVFASHLYVPKDIVESVDYFIYDKDDIPSTNFRLFYHYSVPGDVSIRTERRDPYHALAGQSLLKEAATFMRHKFKSLHFIQYDTVMKIKEYVEAAQKSLQKYEFFGAEYRVPAQNLSGLVCTFFSFNIKWFDDNFPEIRTWDEYRSYARDEGDNLMGENWMHNYFTDHGMIPKFYFMKTEEFQKYVVAEKIKTVGNTEPGMMAYLSELEDHRLILFVHLSSPGTLNYFVNANGHTENVSISNGQLCWKILDKVGYVVVKSKEQSYTFHINPNKEYTETVFNFEDGRFKCLKK